MVSGGGTDFFVEVTTLPWGGGEMPPPTVGLDIPTKNERGCFD
jgi:hypothetical protein